jgi:hypothetical protein
MTGAATTAAHSKATANVPRSLQKGLFPFLYNRKTGSSSSGYPIRFVVKF